MSVFTDLIPPRGPIRILALSNLLRTIGTGLLITVSVLYFVRSAGLAATQVGLGLTVASVIGALFSVPAGHAADRLGPRDTTVVFAALQGIAVCGYAFVGGLPAFVAVATLVLTFESGAGAARGALVAAAVPVSDRVRSRAYLRSIANVGVSLGAVLGGLALSYDTAQVYLAAIWAAGAMVVVSALAYRLLAQTPPVPRPTEGPRLLVLRDRPVAVLAVLVAVLAMNNGLLQVALPLWIAERTDAPVSVYAAIVLLNTIMVVLFQVRVSRGVEQVPAAARAHRRAGLLLTLTCAIWAAAAGQPAWVAVVALVLGAATHVFAELLFEAGTWTLSYDLAPEHAHGQYQGLFGMAEQIAWVAAPALAAAAIIGYGWPGWLAFGSLMALAGLAVPPVTRWAQRTRERYLRTVPTPETEAEPQAGTQAETPPGTQVEPQAEPQVEPQATGAPTAG